MLTREDLDHILKYTDFSPFRDTVVLITGATGWFGSWITEALLEADRYLRLNMRVLISSRQPEAAMRKYPGVYRAYNGYPTEIKSNWIIHLAPTHMYPLVEYAIKSRPSGLLFTSSGAVYGERGMRENDNYNPNSIYGYAKLNDENYLLTFFEATRCKIARCFTFVGGGYPRNRYAIGNFIDACVEHEPIDVWGMGFSIRSYMYMADLVIWLLTLLTRGRVGQIYNVGSEEPISIIELAEKLAALFSLPIVHVMEKRELRPLYVPDCSKAKHLGLKERIPLEEAILRTIEWRKNNG